MCIIIDACTFSRVFNKDDVDFEPVRQWLVGGKGKMVFGGSSYAKELAQLGRYVSLVAELTRQGKTTVLDKAAVDAGERRVRGMESSPDFDDPHLVAIIEESGCRLVCTLDARADRFILDRRFYVKARRPSIYRARSHRHLLRDSNIVGACVA